jgi:hypothetical protein
MAVVFVIHAPEDSQFFNQITSHARSAKLPIEFDHMQLKLASVPNWKEQCRNRIYRSSGAIILLSQHTKQEGVSWELQCAQAFNTPILGVHTTASGGAQVPEGLVDSDVIEWNWPRIASFMQSLTKGSSAYA